MNEWYHFTICPLMTLRTSTRRPPNLCAHVSKAGVLPLGSPSLSILLLKEKDLAEEIGSGTMYQNVAPHAWSPPTFPHSDNEPKVRYAPGHRALYVCNDDRIRDHKFEISRRVRQ